MNLAELECLLQEPEGQALEFKQARQQFHFDKLVRYCAAIANEGGGYLIFGVSDRRPRQIVGTQAVNDPEGMGAKLLSRLPLRVVVQAVEHPDGRVVVFEIPSRPLGRPIEVDGAYWMRAGEQLVPMTPDVLERIFAERIPDVSAQVTQASLSDLHPDAIETFRERWARKSRNPGLRTLSAEQLLQDAGLLTATGQPTIAALVLFAKREAMRRHLPQAEVILEYRSNERAGPASQRKEYQEGFFLWFDDIWTTIDLRNDRQHFQSGLFMLDVATFHEAVIRELVLNAVSHRDYQRPGSVFVRQFARRLEVVSPGGFPRGITPENVLWRQEPRNRLIASALALCGLVERAGQGMNRVFEETIKHGQPRPTFEDTDAWQVSVLVSGLVEDPRFVEFLERLGQERLEIFGTHHFLALDHVHRGDPIPEPLRPALAELVEHGAVERHGRGGGTRHILSRKLYTHIGHAGTYTRRRGLDRPHSKALLLQHIDGAKKQGARMAELLEVLPDKSRGQVKVLLEELRTEGEVECHGRTRNARWFSTNAIGSSANAAPMPDEDLGR